MGLPTQSILFPDLRSQSSQLHRMQGELEEESLTLLLQLVGLAFLTRHITWQTQKHSNLKDCAIQAKTSRQVTHDENVCKCCE